MILLLLLMEIVAISVFTKYIDICPVIVLTLAVWIIINLLFLEKNNKI